jgi:hypothetical protein
MLPSLTAEEKSSLHIEDIDGDCARVWYPKTKWDGATGRKPKDFKTQIQEALEKEDWKLVAKLQAERKETL